MPERESTSGCYRESRPPVGSACPSTLPCPTNNQGDSGSAHVLSLSHLCLLTTGPYQGYMCPHTGCACRHAPSTWQLVACHSLTTHAAAAPIRCQKHCQAFQISKIEGTGEHQLESTNICYGCSKDDKLGAGGWQESASTICPERTKERG